MTLRPRSIILLSILTVLVLGVALPGSPLIGRALDIAIKFKFPGVRQVSPSDLVIWWQSPDRPPPLLIDARSYAEFRVSHLKDAVNIDPESPDLSALGGYRRTMPVVVYDAAGIRGVALAEAMRQQGYEDVSNLSGGIFRWANDGRPLVDHDGNATTLVHPWRAWWSQLLKAKYRAQPGQ